MKRKNKWTKCVLALVMAVAMCVTGIWPNGVATTLAEENPFADVKETGWEYPFVKFAYDRGIMGGKGTDPDSGKVIFEPSKSITRAEVVQILHSMEGYPEVEYDDVFTDVPDGKWFTKAVIWAYSEGITAGNGTKFDVSAPITREQMATMLYAYADYKEYDVTGVADLSGFSDVSKISNWAVPKMQWALHCGIMGGTSDNRIAARENATRAQAATMMKNLIETYENNDDDEVAVTALTLSQTAVTLTEGDTATLTVTYTPDNTTQTGVTWSSSNESIVTVSNGVVTAEGVGAAIITVTSVSNPQISATCTVRVEAEEIPDETYGAYQNDNGSVTVWVLSEESATPITVYYVLNNTNPQLSQTIGVNMTKDASKGEKYYSATITGLNYTEGATFTYLIGYVPLGTVGRQDTPFTTITLGDTSGGGGNEDTEVAITGLALNPAAKTLTVGGSATLTAVYTPSNTTQRGVTWVSSAPGVATVSNGVVTAVSEGTAVITVTSTVNPSLTATCAVTVEAASEQPITPSAEYGVKENGNGSLTLWVLARNVDPAPTAFYVLNNPNAPANQIPGYNMTKDATKGDNYYSVTVPAGYVAGDTCTYFFAYVPVDGIGRVESPRITVTLTGEASGGDEETDVPITALGLNKTTASVEVGGAMKLTAVYTPTNTTEKGVTWSSNNEAVATVVDGRVTGVTEGTAVITATSTVNAELTASCTVTVIAEQPDSPPPAKDDQMYFYFKNETGGEFTDDQIYWCILGKDPTTHELCYVGTDGELIPATPALNTLDVGDRKCAKIFHTLEEQDFVYMPNIESGRMYFSYDSPVYITINVAADGTIGYAGPDLNNTSDPNQDVLFEFIEFTINPPAPGSQFTVGEYWGNTTRVDFFSFPIVATLEGEGGWVNTPGDADVFKKTVGDIGTREEIFAAFKEEVPDEFKTLVNDLRIMAPCKTTFNEGQIYGNYFDDYIDSIYEEYKDKDLVFTCQPGTFRGRTTADGTKMIFRKDGDNVDLVVNKPTTQDALEGKGTLATGSSLELVVQAQFCAAINRGVAHLTDSQWDKEELFYQNEVANFYSAFFHRHSIDRLAYGFCYDDVYDHSTLLHYTKPTGLTIELKW